eukprot:880156-Pyramimonas_sp.AAC.1
MGLVDQAGAARAASRLSWPRRSSAKSHPAEAPPRGPENRGIIVPKASLTAMKSTSLSHNDTVALR